MSPIHSGGAIHYGNHAAAPTNPAPTQGSTYYNTGDNKKYLHNGTDWYTFTTTLAFDGANITHWWKSEGIQSNDLWNAAKGGKNLQRSGADTMTYTSSDSNFNGKQSISNNADSTANMQTDTDGVNTFWNANSEAFSVLVACRKTQHNGSNWGDSVFVQGVSSGPDGDWCIGIYGDHSWGGQYGESLGQPGSSGLSGSLPYTGILCIRQASNGTGDSLFWQSGQTSWISRGTSSGWPSSLPNNGYSRLRIFNAESPSHNAHRFTGTIAEIAYYKGTQIDNTERDACKDYMVEKFGI
tara:strand:- start:261 stop:1148 length:888 start_codon:yes stop_codon:yes gene_type:complete